MTLDHHRLVSLTVLDLGLFDVGPGRRLIGIPGFLLKTEDGRGGGAHILFDTGFDPDYATAPEATATRDGLGAFGVLVDFTERQTAAGQLALLGLTPADISHVILSHGHIDHVGSLPLFAHAEIVLTATERADERPCYFGTARPIDWPAARYRTITTETRLCEGLTLIPTPGHTAGHLSAHLGLHDGRQVILAADAINRISEPDEAFADARDPAAAMASYLALAALAESTGATIIYGHEPTQWPKLPKAPHSY
jgi:N-acyl homoserine lactone hydrolase